MPLPTSHFFVVLFTATLLRDPLRTEPAPGAGDVRCLGSTRYRHPAAILQATVAPDGRTLFTLSEKGVYAWDLETGDGRPLFADERGRNALHVSPDGTRLVSISR